MDLPGGGGQALQQQQQHQQQTGTQGPTAGTCAHSNVYVRNIPKDATEAFVQQLFAPSGQIVSVSRIFRSGSSHSASDKPAFCFVKFSTIAEAQAAINSLNGTQLGGLVLEVRFADSDAGASHDKSPPPSDNLYIKNLPAHYTEQALMNLLSPFGVVTMCRILHRGEEAAGHGAAGLVRMSTKEEAAQAIQGLHNHRPGGATQSLVLRYADSAEVKARKQAKQQLVPASPQQPPQPHPAVVPFPVAAGAPAVGGGSSGGPGSASGGGRYEPLRAAGRGGGGPVSHVVAAPSNSGGMRMLDTAGLMAPVAPAQLGYGEPYAAGHAALMTPPHLGSGHAALYGDSTVLLQHAMPSGIPVVPMPASLYVKNLPDGADKLFLYEKFAPFGAVLSVRVLVDDAGRPKGVGFVNFVDHTAAAKAAAALNNLPVAGDKTLHVSFQTHRAR